MKNQPDHVSPLAAAALVAVALVLVIGSLLIGERIASLLLN